MIYLFDINLNKSININHEIVPKYIFSKE